MALVLLAEGDPPRGPVLVLIFSLQTWDGLWALQQEDKGTPWPVTPTTTIFGIHTYTAELEMNPR